MKLVRGAAEVYMNSCFVTFDSRATSCCKLWVCHIPFVCQNCTKFQNMNLNRRSVPHAATQVPFEVF